MPVTGFGEGKAPSYALQSLTRAERAMIESGSLPFESESYAYTYGNKLSTLYVAEGLR